MESVCFWVCYWAGVGESISDSSSCTLEFGTFAVRTVTDVHDGGCIGFWERGGANRNGCHKGDECCGDFHFDGLVVKSGSFASGWK